MSDYLLLLFLSYTLCFQNSETHQIRNIELKLTDFYEKSTSKFLNVKKNGQVLRQNCKKHPMCKSKIFFYKFKKVLRFLEPKYFIMSMFLKVH